MFLFLAVIFDFIINNSNYDSIFEGELQRNNVISESFLQFKDVLSNTPFGFVGMIGFYAFIILVSLTGKYPGGKLENSKPINAVYILNYLVFAIFFSLMVVYNLRLRAPMENVNIEEIVIMNSSGLLVIVNLFIFANIIEISSKILTNYFRKIDLEN